MDRRSDSPVRKALAATFVPGLLVVAAVTAYGNALTGPFVFDDIDAIVENLT